MIVIDLTRSYEKLVFLPPPRAAIDPRSFFICAITSRARITSIIYRDRVD